MPKTIEKLIIQFDSSAALLKSLALFHQDLDFEKGGLSPDIPFWISYLINRTPRVLRQYLYSWSGWIDAIQKNDLDQIDPQNIGEWVTSLYPPKSYNGAMFGASNGAAIHLAAALGIPWLPQTYLVAIRRMMNPDQIHKDIQWGEKTIRPFLQKHPCIHASQMHDPVQDRLMVSKMGYFRLKLIDLPNAFTRFLSEHLSPNKPLITIECNYLWPSLDIGKRHTFQLGGFGAIDPYEYLRGSNRTRQFLKKINSSVPHWETFKPSREIPEAEWGYFYQCHEQLLAITKRKQAPFYRLIFNDPEGLSDFTCDIYRWWYQKRNQFKSNRMLIENFALVAPYRIVQSGTLPFWLAFNTQNSCERLEAYLKKHRDLSYLYLLLMSNGVTEGIGLATIDQWQKVLKLASKEGRLIGVDEREYPLDFATFLRYQKELIKCLANGFPKPSPLTIEEVKEFIEQSSNSYSLILKEEYLNTNTC